MCRSMLPAIAVLLLFVSKPDGASAQCDVELALDGSESTFAIAGSANATILNGLTLAPKNPDQVVGLIGSLLLSSEKDCPKDSSELVEFAKGAKIVKPDSPLALYPDGVQLVVDGGIAELTFAGVEMELTSEGLSVEEDVVEGSFNMTITSGVVDYVVTLNLGDLDVAPGNASVTGLSSIAELKGTIEMDGAEVVLKIEEVGFSFDVAFETGIELVPSIETRLELDGKLDASGGVGCDGCGENGRCVSTEEGDAVCQCACGWGGSECSERSGFCDRFGLLATSSLGLQENSSNETSMAASLSEEDLEETCSELFSSRQCVDWRSKFSPKTQVCECEADWEGKDCDMCTANKACDEFLGVTGSACKFDFAYEERTALKLYECDLTGTSYESFVGSALNFKCNTTGPGFSSDEVADTGEVVDVVGSSPFCEVEFDYLTQTPVNCTAWGCRYAVGGSDVKCQTMICDCKSDCPDSLSSIIKSITAVDFTCDEGTSECIMAFGGALPVEVKAGCKARECYDSNAPVFLQGGFKDEGFKFKWNVLIISLPPVVVVFLALALGFPTYALSRKMRWQPEDVGAASHRKLSWASINNITFHNVVCSVPVVGETDTTLLTKSSPSDLESKGSPMGRSFTMAGLDPGLFELMDSRRNYKSILHGLTGTFRKGDLVGVMGPSGGGKTTFLSIISNMSSDANTQRSVKGSILVDGRPQGNWTKRLSAFVPQEDKLLATLTVRESLMYSAILRLHGSSMDSIYRRTEEVLHELGLVAVARSLVGGVRNMRGISGGERRRVTIGMELITDPRLVIMDEPLSGLDSYSALNLMYTLKSVSSAGRMVVLSLHQPTPAMLNLLDQMLLLAKGFQVYLGKPQDAPKYFADAGFVCPEATHIAEYLLQAISNQQTLVPLLNAVYSQTLKPALEQPIVRSDSGEMVGHHVETLEERQHFKDLQVLTWRGFVDIVRNPSLLLAHVIMASIVGITCGVVFFDASFDLNGAQNRLGGIFFSLAFLAFSSLTTTDLLHTERGIVIREIKGGYYGSGVYVLSKVLLDAILLRILPAVLLGTPVYLMMGMQQKLTNYVIFMFGVCTFNLVIGALSMAITILAPTPGIASLCINTYLLFGLLMMGHLVHLPSIPGVVRWMHYVSPFAYAFQALAVSEMATLKLNFVVPGYASVDGISGEVFLRTVGLEKDELRRNLWALDLFYVGAVIVVFLALTISMHDGRRQRFFNWFKRRVKRGQTRPSGL
ncbi:hypothetical protein BSKO_03412 [Bryopsis sp. KO-2023]|nr:hypothetical protein BSKO_03412 [Bryopsis sp. KO-2023]